MSFETKLNSIVGTTIYEIMNKYLLVISISVLGSFAYSKDESPLLSIGGSSRLADIREVKVTVRLKNTTFDYEYDFGKLEDVIASHEAIKSIVSSCAPALGASAKSLELNQFMLYFYLKNKSIERIGYSSKTIKGFAFSEGSQFRECLVLALREKLVKK